MARRSLHLWNEFFSRENHPDFFRRTGVLWMAEAGEPSVREAKTIFERLRIRHEWLDAKAIAERYQQFQTASHTIALFEPEAGALLAERSVEAVVAAGIRAGVTYERAKVKAPVLDRPRLAAIETTGGRRLAADHFVFACGSWLPKLFGVLTNVIRPTRQDLFFFAVPETVDGLREGALPIWIDQTDLKIAYGFPDLGSGLKLGFHRLGPPFDPDLPRHNTKADQIEEAAAYLARRVPRMRDAQVKTTHFCHYENTPNGDFLIDLHPGTQNVWLVGGGSGHGFKHAPAVAEYLTAVIGGASGREVRFSLSAKQNTISGRVL
jgi:glycine/D-amino acid oxidase-like deaminating enzyme